VESIYSPAFEELKQPLYNQIQYKRIESKYKLATVFPAAFTGRSVQASVESVLQILK